MENDNTRAEKLKDNIEETDEDISKLQIVIQKLTDIKKDNYGLDIGNYLSEAIDFCDNQIKFLEDVKESDEKALNLFC